jgi:hypothetical protein
MACFAFLYRSKRYGRSFEFSLGTLARAPAVKTRRCFEKRRQKEFDVKDFPPARANLRLTQGEEKEVL